MEHGTRVVFCRINSDCSVAETRKEII